MGRTLRQFTCRDDLWVRVEALADRRGISPDEVIQAALVQLFSRKADTPGMNAARPTPASIPAAAAGATPRSIPSSTTPVPQAPSMRPPSAPLPRPAAANRLPPPTARSVTATAVPSVRPLFLYFEGQVYEVNQDQFVIGRGSKYSDLPIKDANISRRHCAIVRRNGQYFIKDLESTNGVEFNGQRVDNHLIQEGTVYRLCDHELRFSFIPPS